MTTDPEAPSPPPELALLWLPTVAASRGETAVHIMAALCEHVKSDPAGIVQSAREKDPLGFLRLILSLVPDKPGDSPECRLSLDERHATVEVLHRWFRSMPLAGTADTGPEAEQPRELPALSQAEAVS